MKLTESGYKYTFRIFPNAEQQSAPLVKVAQGVLKARNAVILHEKTNAGNDNAEGFKKPFEASGGKVLATIDFGRDVNDFTAIATRIASLGKVDVLPTFALEGQQVRLSQALAQAKIVKGGGGNAVQMGSIWLPFGYDQKAGQAAEGYVRIVQFDPNEKRKIVQDFVKAYQAKYGVYLGCLYVMVALGLTLIYGVLNQINFAHADFVTVGAFTAYFTVTRLATKLLGLPDAAAYLLSIFTAFGIGALLGLAVNAAVFAPLRERGDELRPLIATIGVSVLLENAQLALFGPIPYQFDSPFARETIRIGRIFFSAQSVLVVAVSALAIGALYAFLRFTFLGKALRAVAQDRETAGLMGINPGLLIGLTIVFASALAGMAGALP